MKLTLSPKVKAVAVPVLTILLAVAAVLGLTPEPLPPVVCPVCMVCQHDDGVPVEPAVVPTVVPAVEVTVPAAMVP